MFSFQPSFLLSILDRTPPWPHYKHDHLSRSNTLSTGKMKPRSLFPLCLLLPAVCGGDGSSAATIVRRRREAQQTQNENDLRRQREVSLSDHSSDIKRFGPGRSLCLYLMERMLSFLSISMLVGDMFASQREKGATCRGMM